MIALGNIRNPATEMIETHLVPNLGYLAGYPRSGAALVRTILANVFGHRTASVYDEGELGAEYAKFIGHLPVTGVLGEMGAIAKKQGVLFFKTHNQAQGTTESPTIIIVRDGRRTLAALKSFYLERNGTDYSWEDIIRGRHSWGNWSIWVASWALHCPQDALWLKYDDLVADAAAGARQIAKRFGFSLPAVISIPRFESMQAASPTIFTDKNVDGNGGMPPEAEDLFWQLHGATQSMLGYVRE